MTMKMMVLRSIRIMTPTNHTVVGATVVMLAKMMIMMVSMLLTIVQRATILMTMMIMKMM